MTTRAATKPDAKLNGVDVTALGETIAAINEKPSLAIFKFRVRNAWVDGGHNRSAVKEFYGAGGEDGSRTQPFVLEADEPPVLLGKDVGANPVEYVLHALASCMTTSLVYHAAARGIRVEEVESRLEGDLDLRGFLGLSPEVRKGYQGVRVSFRVKSDGSPEALRECAFMSPVCDIVSNGVPVAVEMAVR